jgi:hypothetical protein
MVDEPTVEGAPPQDKRSFVNPDDVQTKEKTEKKETKEETTVEGKKIPILRPEIALTLIYGKICALLDEMKALNSVFSKAASESKTFSQSTQPMTPQSPDRPATKPTEQTPRIKEILAALAEEADLLNIDTDSSTMFVIIKPRQFLGSDNFSKIAAKIRTLGGQYCSAGKNSHFEISKVPPKH